MRVSAPSPFVAGELTAPRGLLLHGSRSGIAGRDALVEYQACRDWAMNPNNGGLGWHASIGPGIVAVHMGPTVYGWNCGSHSSEWIAVEFAQPTIDDAIDDSQVDAYCWWVRNEVLAAWPNLPHVIMAHSELNQGQREGKTDVFPRGSAALEEVKQRIRERLGW